MTTPKRIKGKDLIFKIDAVDYKCDATSVMLEPEEPDSDGFTFCDAADGTMQWFFTVSAVVSTETAAFWRYLWANTGETDVPYVYAPHGNAIASATQPHFTGTVTIPAKPAIGGEANATQTFEVRIDCNEEPTLVVAP